MSGKAGQSQYKGSVTIESKHRAYLIGHRGKRINKIRDDCNNVMIIIPKPDRPGDPIEVTGKEVDVKKAIAKISAVCQALRDAENSKPPGLAAPAAAAAAAAGGGGGVPGLPSLATPNNGLAARPATRGELCQECCCEVTGASSTSPEKCPCPAGGTPGGSYPDAKTGSHLPSSSDSFSSNGSPPDSSCEEKLTVSKQLTGILCAYSRKLLRSISLECERVRIAISDANEVTVTGSEDGVAYAMDQLEKLNKDPDSVLSVQHIAVKRHLHKYLLSSYGVHSRLLRVNAGVRVILPDSMDTNPELIYIVGRKKETQEVKKKMETVVGTLTKHCRHSLPVPGELANRLTEDRGKMLKQIAGEVGCGVHLHVEGVERSGGNDASRLVVFSGPAACLPAVEDRIKDSIAELASFRTQACPIPFELFDAVKGPNNTYTEQLMEDYEVSIVFPPYQPPRQKHMMDHVGDVKVSGQIGDVERACEELMASVPVCHEVRVPLEYYSFFAGHKSSYLNQLKEEFQVIIKVKPAEEFHGVIVVIGPEDDVISCCQYIEQQVGLLSQERNHREKLRFSMKIEVPVCHQKKLIGKKGAKLRQLCSTFHVDITMPPKDGKEDTTVLLQGYEERCRQAAEEITHILDEMEDRTVMKVETIPGDFHRKLVGHHGRNIRAISGKYHVEIKVPRSQQEGEITITGASQNVADCAQHIQTLADQFLKDQDEEQDQKEVMSLYTYASKKRVTSISDVFRADGQHTGKVKAGTGTNSSTNSSSKGFVVSGAPWSGDTGDAKLSLGPSPATLSLPKRFAAVVTAC